MQHAKLQFDRDQAAFRFAKRFNKSAPGTVRTAANLPMDVLLTDISTDGFAFVSEMALPVGSLILISVSGLQQRRATIVRRIDGLHGCVFHHPISTELVAAVGLSSSDPIAAVLPSREPSEPFVQQWPRAARLATLAICTAATWGLVLLIANWAFK